MTPWCYSTETFDSGHRLLRCMQVCKSAYSKISTRVYLCTLKNYIVVVKPDGTIIKTRQL